METLKKIIRKVLSEQEEEQLSIDFPEKLTKEKAIESLKKNFIKIAGSKERWGGRGEGEPWYHTGGGFSKSGEEEQSVISIYTKNLGSFPLMFRVDNFDSSLPVKVEYRGTSAKGKLFAKLLDSMDSNTFINLMSSPPINYNFSYKSTPDVETSEKNIQKYIKPMFAMLDRWLPKQGNNRYNRRGYSPLTDGTLINKFFKEIAGVTDASAVDKLTKWYLRSKAFSKEESSMDIDIEKYKEGLRKFEFTIDKKQIPCDYQVKGYILAKNQAEAERLIKNGRTENMLWVSQGKPKCADQLKYKDGDSLSKLKPSRAEDTWSYRNVGNKL